MTDDAVLEVEDLVAGYGSTKVIHGLSLSVAARGVTVLLGANGAGKTTLMKTLAGLVKPVAGSFRLLGEDITRMSSDSRVTRGMVLVPEGRMVFPHLSVRENLRLGAINARAIPAWKRTLDHVYHVFPKLREREKQQASTLSGGEQQMLAIGRGLMALPKLMLLDEPSLGLAPVMSKQIFELVQRLSDQGLALLLAEQDVYKSLAVASRAYVVENGRIAATGSPDEIVNDPRIRQAYLGL